MVLEIPQLSLRSLLQTGSVGLLTAVAGPGIAATGAGLPGPTPLDRGKVEGGKVVFENWRGEADRPSSPPPAPLPPGERVGGTVGRYKLLERIGEGGFGLVFMAEQQHPVRRKVALKVIKPGLDTRQVIARFEAERQALALMNHPNVAKVLDAGASDAGRPYFVMEYVPGEAITAFCDRERYTIEQ